MNFVLGTTIRIFLACIISSQASASETREEAVFFRSVLMLKQDNKSSLNELANVWMDIQKGLYPNVSSEDKRIKVGEPITILIYLSDIHKRNIVVDECWAYNEEKYDNSTINLQLTNKTTNFQKSIMMNQLPRKVYSHAQNITLLYTNLTSFKFPEKEYVNIACSVELCRGSCSEKPIRRRFPPKHNSTTMEESQPQAASRNNTKFLFSKLKPPPSYTTESTSISSCTPKSKHLICFLRPPSQCTHGSKDPYCFNTKPPTNCHADSQDPKCHTKPPTHCYPGSPDPQCNVNYPPTCYPDSKDNHCQNTPPPTDCYPGSQNPQCHTNPPTYCYPGSQDPQCQSNSSMPSDCFPGSQELHCNSGSQPPNCYPGSPNPQCNSNLPRNCHPGSEDPECNSDPPTCYPGSQNPHCNSSHPPNCHPGSEDPQCNSSSPPNCYPGSQDPRCNLSSLPNCFPGSQNPHCNFLAPQCYPGSQNPHCTSVSPPPICYPGSQNILCKSIPRCSPNSQDPKCTNIIKVASHCNSSVFDPRCIFSPVTNYNANSSDSPCNTKAQNCFPGSKNPQCASNSATRICVPHNTKYILNKNKPKQPILCFFNLLNPKCQHIRKKRSSTARATEESASISDDITNFQPKLASSPACSSHSDSIDPRCGVNIDIAIKPITQSTVPIKCVLGLFNRRCITETSAHKKLAYNPLLPPNCYPSSKDPRCKTLAPDESVDFINQYTHNSFKPPNCYPGSKDPRCSKYS